MSVSQAMNLMIVGCLREVKDIQKIKCLSFLHNLQWMLILLTDPFCNCCSPLISLVVQFHFFQTWEAGLSMDADNNILLAQCPSNRARPVCRFAIDYLGQDRCQRLWSAKCA